MEKSLRVLLLSTFIGSVLTFFFLLPVLSHAASHLPSREDGVLISYLIHWVSYALLHGKNIFQVPFFYPYQNTLAYSDPYLSTGLLNIPLLFFTSNIVLASNIHAIGGTIFLFVGMALLVQHFTDSYVAAFFSAIAFTFSFFHFQALVHLHLYLFAGVPFCLYFFLLWLERNRKIFLAAAAMSFLYQVLNSPMTGYFLLFILLPIFIQKNTRHFLWLNKKIVAATLIITAGICILFYLPYWQVSREFNYVRPFRDTAHFAQSLDIFFHQGFLVMFSLVILFWLTRKKQKLKSFITLSTLLLITGIGAAFMLGPVLKIHDQTFKIFSIPIPLPYFLAYYIVPGFKAFRDSGRWLIVFGFGLSLLLGKLSATSRIPQKFQIALLVGLTIFLWFTQVPALHLYPIPLTVPPIYNLVQKSDFKIIAELPVYSWRMMPYNAIENDRLMYQIFHNKTLHNGVSGFTPPQREADWDWLWANFPNQQSLAFLQQQHVQLLVVHFKEIQNQYEHHFIYNQQPAQDSETIKHALNTSPILHLLGCQENDCAYTLQ